MEVTTQVRMGFAGGPRHIAAPAALPLTPPPPQQHSFRQVQHAPPSAPPRPAPPRAAPRRPAPHCTAALHRTSPGVATTLTLTCAGASMARHRLYPVSTCRQDEGQGVRCQMRCVATVSRRRPPQPAAAMATLDSARERPSTIMRSSPRYTKRNRWSDAWRRGSTFQQGGCYSARSNSVSTR